MTIRRAAGLFAGLALVLGACEARKVELGTGSSASGASAAADARAGEDAAPGAVCGDGVVDPGESCDGAALGAATCASLGFVAGPLACGADCAFDTGGCEDAPACADDGAEPNDAQTDAAPIAPGGHDLVLCGTEDAPGRDWFALSVPDGGVVGVGVTWTPPLGSEGMMVAAWAAAEGAPWDQERVRGDDPEMTAGLTWFVYAPPAGQEGLYTIHLRADLDPMVGRLDYHLAFVVDVACVGQHECLAGTYCDVEETFACQPGCWEPNDCPGGGGEICEDHVCLTPECRSHDDCRYGEACLRERYACVETDCVDERDCRPYGSENGRRMVCHPTEGVCLQCAVADDCRGSEGNLCERGRCAWDCDEDGYMPNRARDEAAPIALTDGTFDDPDLALCGGNAIDWFRFGADTDGPLLVRVTFAGEADAVRLALYQDDGEDPDTPVATSERGVDGAALFVAAAPAGSWSLLVEPDAAAPPLPIGGTAVSRRYGLHVGTHEPDCVDQAGCAERQLCLGYRCESDHCDRDGDCPPGFGLGLDLPYCDLATSACVQCREDEHCGLPRRCEAGFCVDD